MLYPNELVIGDHNWRNHVEYAGDGGEERARGLVPRDLMRYPPGYSPRSVLGIDFPLIPQEEWSKRIADKAAEKSRISDLRLVGNAGQPIPSLDQDGKGYCLPAGVPVLMADGSHKPIEQVRVGDMVLGHSGTPRRVGTTSQKLYTGDILALRVDGLERPLHVTADHRIFTPERLGNATPSGHIHYTDARFFTTDSRVYRGIGPERGRQVGWEDEARVRSVGCRAVKDLLVHDIGVEEEHCFIAAGVLVHNCWAHSSTSAVMMLRCVQNQPYVPLSAYAIACIIKSYRDEGGWGCQSLDFICDRGVPSDKFWPMQSMSRSNDKPETWENAKLHRVTEGWNDLSVAQYDRNLTYAQVITLLLSNVPVVVDFNWWSHSVCAIDAVDGASCRPTYRNDRGKKPNKAEFDLAMGMDDPVTAGINIRILNSWGDSWSDRGMGVLSGSKAVPNGSGAPRVTGASVN